MQYIDISTYRFITTGNAYMVE